MLSPSGLFNAMIAPLAPFGFVSSPQVPHPVAVRYDWADSPDGNLTNGAGIPASPFRTDDTPGITANSR
jgi:sialate O-acetylesterase